MTRAEWLEAAIRDYESRLLGYVVRLTGDRDTARDVVQDAFERLCHQDPAKLNGRLAPWLYTVCRNRALDVRKKEGRMATATQQQLEAMPAARPSPSLDASRNEEHARTLAAVDALPEKQREVFRLKFGDGMSYREISEVTGYSIAAISKYMNQALTTLRASLAEHSDAAAAMER